MTNRDIVLDTNVLVGLLDRNDSLHQRAVALLERVQEQGDRLVMLDFVVAEMFSVLCRRATQRRANPPDLAHARTQIRSWLEADAITFVHQAVADLFEEIIDTAEASGGALNFNDAALVLLQREGTIFEQAEGHVGIGPVATSERAQAELETYGYLSADERRRIARDTVSTVVRPAARAVLESERTRRVSEARGRCKTA